MSIRRAELSDAKGMAAVLVAAWQGAYRGFFPDEALDRLSPGTAEERWSERIARPWGHIFVAEHEGAMVGFVVCGRSEDKDIDQERAGELYVLYVHPQKWQQGYGMALLSQAMECLREDGFEEIILWVLSGNERAIRFYEAAGFAADGASKTKQREDGLEMLLIRYRRRLEHPIVLTLKEELARWQELLIPLSEELVTAPQPASDWSIKDVLAHLWAWQQVSIARLEAAHLDREPLWPDWLAGLDPDAEEYLELYNTQIYEANRHEPWVRVHRRWRDGFLRLLKLGQAIPDDGLLDRERYLWLKRYALLAVLEGTHGHHREHRESVLAWLGQQQSPGTGEEGGA